MEQEYIKGDIVMYDNKIHTIMDTLLLIIMILIAVISVVAATVSIFSIIMYIIKNDIL